LFPDTSVEFQKTVRRYIPEAAAPYLKRLAAGFPPRWPGFKRGNGHVGFVVDKVALGQVFSSTSISLANLDSTNFSTITFTYHPGLAQ
jgi:hypothetical protein